MHPEQINDDGRAGVLELVWQDGLTQHLTHAFLRSQCKCAGCRSGSKRTGDLPAAAPGLRISRILPVGAYGVQLIFSDGHERGIYPWPYLRSLGQDLGE